VRIGTTRKRSAVSLVDSPPGSKIALKTNVVRRSRPTPVSARSIILLAVGWVRGMLEAARPRVSTSTRNTNTIS
jgi:hypothetical protein